MSYRLVVRPEVDFDLDEALVWYDEHEPGLGSEFVKTIRHELRSLIAQPLLYRIRHQKRGIRWMIPAQFPYRIIYYVTKDTIVVVAVIHAARQDRVWQDRL